MTTERRSLRSGHAHRLWSRLWATLTGRPRWQRIAATAVSLWWLLWLADRFGPSAVKHTPIGVLHGLLGWAGVHGPTGLDAVMAWLRDPGHRGFLTASAWLAGVCWAAASERTVLPTLLGWTVVLTASEGLGYDAVAPRAAGGFLAVVAVLLVLSWPLRRARVIRRARLLPTDVLLGAGKAAALCVLFIGYAAVRAVSLVCAPYLTRPPKPDSRRPVLAARPQPTPSIPEPARPLDDLPATHNPVGPTRLGATRVEGGVAGGAERSPGALSVDRAVSASERPVQDGGILGTKEYGQQ